MLSKDEKMKNGNPLPLYEQPAIIYDGSITTRAGSPLGGGDGNGADGVDPADLFGE